MKDNQTKIALSKDELDFVTNARILLTKNEIIKKVYELFGLLAEQYMTATQQKLANAAVFTAPKISRGENYRGLPWVMLDFPREFKKTDTFAIRTFFWWGNFFSITLQLSGRYQEMYLSQIREGVKGGALNHWYAGVGDDPWEHHFEDNNYKLLTPDTNLSNTNFNKLATKIPLEEWDSAQHFLQNQFYLLLQILASNTMK